MLRFSEGSIDLEAPRGGTSNGYPVQVIGNVALNGAPISLETDRSWLAAPGRAAADGSVSIGVNALELKNGVYTGTVTATAPGFVPGTLRVRVTVKDHVASRVKVNFQDPTFLPPAGYRADVGEAYGLRGGGLIYGWIDPGTGAPAENLSSARGSDRGVTSGSADSVKLFHSFNMFDKLEYNPRRPRYWEVAVPNGRYRVELAVGDVLYVDSRHTVRAEGVTLVNDHIPSRDQLFYVASGEVEVVDGKLTLDNFGIATDGNAKLIYVTATQVTGQWMPPALRLSATGSRATDTTFTGTASVTLQALANAGGERITSLTYSIDGGTATDYSGAFTLSLPAGTDRATYQLLARAVDARGSATSLDTAFTLVRGTGALVRIENLTKLPGTNRSFPAEDFFTFHRTRSNKEFNGRPVQFSETNRMRVHNDGTTPLVLTRLGVTDSARFVIEGAPTVAAPRTIAPGGFADFTARFTAVEPIGVSYLNFPAKVLLASNADNAGDLDVTFMGAYTQAIEGNNEMTNQQLFEAFGLKTEMGRDERFKYITYPSSDRPSDARVNAGDEGSLILPGLFEQADPGQALQIFQLGAFHGFSGENTQILNSSGQRLNNFIFNHDPYYFNTLLPPSNTNAAVIAGARTGRITVPFAVSIGGYRSMGGNYYGQYADRLLGMRVYKVLDREGKVVANEYILIQDYVGNGCAQGGGNCDWQDNVVYLINARPVAKPAAGSLPDLYATAGTAAQSNVLSRFTTGYPGNELTFSATLADGTALPDWIAVDAKAGKVALTAPFSYAGRTFDLRLTATDANGIRVSGNLRVIVSGAAGDCTVSANQDGQPKVIFCAGSGIRLSGFASSGIYRWTGPDGFTSPERHPVVSVPGVYTLASQTIGGVSCGNPASVTVTLDLNQAPQPTVTAATFSLN